MPQPSIHYRRRWFYVLWCVLLALSGLALLLWETPSARELASFEVLLSLPDAPAGTRVQAWAGPWAQWPGEAWSGADAFADLALGAGGLARLPVVRLHIARRRFHLGYVPRGTWDLVMLKFSPPSEPPRYLALPCSQDIRTGVLRPKFRLTGSIDISWRNLRLDGLPPNRIP